MQSTHSFFKLFLRINILKIKSCIRKIEAAKKEKESNKFSYELFVMIKKENDNQIDLPASSCRSL